MVIIAAVEAVVILAIVVLFLRHVQSVQAQATAERGELLTRIQHPEIVPRPEREGVEVPAREPDQWNRVGQIQVTREWLDGED